MAIGSITYQTVVNQVKTWISSNCMNIANFAGIPAAYKAGFTNSNKYAGNGVSDSYADTTITGNIVTQVSSDTVNTDMTNFLTSIQIGDLNRKIPESEFYNFILDMMVFCSTKLSFVGGGFGITTKILIYDTSHTTYVGKETLTTYLDYKVADHMDVIDYINLAITINKQNIREKSPIYTINLHS